MALVRNKRHDEGTATRGESDRAGPAPGLVRALVTLLGLAAAGLLVWLASTFDLGSTSEFWIAMGLLAAAGLVLGLSQLLGGWTKWGWPRFSPSVFLFAFLPTLVVAGGILLAMRPAGEETRQVRGWAEDIGIGGLVEDFWDFPGLLAFAIGLVLAFCFDTSGPRTRIVSPDARDDDVYARRGPDARTEAIGATPTRGGKDDRTGGPAGATAVDSDRTVAEELRSRGDRADTVSTRPVDERDDRSRAP